MAINVTLARTTGTGTYANQIGRDAGCKLFFFRELLMRGRGRMYDQGLGISFENKTDLPMNTRSRTSCGAPPTDICQMTRQLQTVDDLGSFLHIALHTEAQHPAVGIRPDKLLCQGMREMGLQTKV
jgi:hypothetical protein